MRKVEYICDRCGSAICSETPKNKLDQTLLPYPTVQAEGMSISFTDHDLPGGDEFSTADLCPKCADQFRKWILMYNKEEPTC